MILENTNDNLKFGMTFSEGISIFQENGDKNIFEKIITINTIEEDESLSQEDKSKLISVLNNNEYTSFQKRIMIMRTLDKEKEFSSQIGLILRERLPKMEMVKKIMLVFRDHYIKKDVLKKEFGEVLTSVETVKMMISEIDKEFWTSPYNEDGSIKKVLETSNGSGVFLWMVIYKFMVGLQVYFKDEDKRYKFIVENMIYACELQKSKMFNWLCIADIYDEYDLNVYCGSFLEEGFDNHMEDVWGLKLGDISLVVSNPPYNGKVSSSGTSSDLYDKFIVKSMKISKMVLMITPSRWFNKSDKKNLRDLMINSGRLYSIRTDNDYFEELNIRGGVSYFLINDKNNDMVLFNGLENNLKLQYEKFGFIFTDQLKSKTVDNILSKISKYSKLSTIFNSKSYFGLKTNHKFVLNEGTKCYFSGRQKYTLNLILDEKNKYFSYVNKFNDGKLKLNRWKLITAAAYGFKTKTENTYNKIGETFISSPGEVCTETFIFFDLDSEFECLNLQKYLNTDFVKYLISLIKVKQDVTSKIFNIVPLLDLKIEWTDEKLFEYFNLSEEEQKLILGK